MASPPNAGSIVDMLPYARQAIDRLGYIKSEYDGTIAVLMERSKETGAGIATNWYHGAGEQLSADEKRALGLRSTTRFSRAALDALTERGRRHALHAHLMTLHFAMQRLRWAETCREAHAQGTDRLKIIGPHRDCRGCLGLSGQMMTTGETALLPPAECDVELCELRLQPWPEWLP